MTRITYPFEIEDAEGDRWIFRSNGDGEVIYTHGVTEPASITCEQLIETIRTGQYFGRVVYAGPQRKRKVGA